MFNQLAAAAGLACPHTCCAGCDGFAAKLLCRSKVSALTLNGIPGVNDIANQQLGILLGLSETASPALTESMISTSCFFAWFL